jgi:TonB-dependent starch-binding outer membrane protein SusC
MNFFMSRNELTSLRGSLTTSGLRLTVLFTIFLLIHICGAAYGQNVSISLTRAPATQLFKQISRQTGYVFWYKAELLKDFRPVTLHATKRPLKEILDNYFKDQPLIYTIPDSTNTILIRRKEAPLSDKIKNTPLPAKSSITGTVTGENLALNGASVIVKRLGSGTFTNSSGEFTLDGLQDDDVIIVSYVGYEKQQITLSGKNSPIFIQLKPSVNGLDEVHVLAYGQRSSQRLNTGSAIKINADVIEKQATSDPLVALQGRVPGMLITNTSGLPGAEPTVQIRGISTLNLDGKSRSPLYIVDGVPFTSSSLSTIASDGFTTGSKESPFKSIDPASIANIEILKDADATAIYGARGANGVILITTKRGEAGKAMINADVYTSFATVPHFIDMLNTQQYLEMRREAAANDGIKITSSAYPDLTKWSQTAYTDWQKAYFGGTARTSNAELNISGGSSTNRFLLGGGYRNEQTIYAKTGGLKTGNIRFNGDNNSKDGKLNASISLNYSGDQNSAIALSPASFYNLPPNYSLYNADGSLNWAVSNPIASSLQTMNNKTKNLNTNFQFGYKVLPGLTLKSSLGYTNMRLNQMYLSPVASKSPTAYDRSGSAYFARNKNSAFSFEPQADYIYKKGKNTIQVLLGGTYISNKSSIHQLKGFQYKDDARLTDINAAGIVDTTERKSQYRFLSAFTRVGYNYDNKYLLNLTLRRDGSSRFGPGKQFGNFWSAGGAWIFTEEAWIKDKLPFVSFGKLRGSYGITGNDNIGDYQYFVNYTKTYASYQSVGLYPTNLYNPDYQWEVNKKLEFAIDLGFLNDRITLSAGYFRNRSGNQLVSYALGSQTGMSDIVKNLDAEIQNSGLEIQLNTTQVRTAHFKWSSGFNISTTRNKLLSFPNLASSSYSHQYKIGEPLSLFWGLKSLDVDPATGKLNVVDINNDGKISYPEDYVPLASKLPSFYGGFSNSISYGQFQADVFFSFRKARLSFTYLSPGAGISNQPVEVLSRWQNPGDITSVPKFTTSSEANYKYNNTEASLYDASYLRLSSLSISYNLPTKVISKLHMQALRFYAMGNNVFTLTKYPGLDPETGISTPTLRNITLGLRSTF